MQEENLKERIERAEAALAEAYKQVQQLRIKLTCMCGSEMNHTILDGHTPVSMYDYSLDQAEERAKRAEAESHEANLKLDEFQRRIWKLEAKLAEDARRKII